MSLQSFQSVGELFGIQLGVNHGAGDGAVAEGLLDGEQVVGFLVQRAGKCVAQRMDSKVLADTGGL